MRYVTGDISKAPEPIIIHGCNMQGKMNSGVAKALRKEFPTIYNDYMEFLPEHNLGEAIISVCPPGKIIGNLLTQEFYGYDRKAYATPGAVDDALNDFLYRFMFKSPITPSHYDSLIETDRRIAIASPKIGCGRGGLVWEDVLPFYEFAEIEYPVDFVIYDIPDEYSN